VRFEVLKLILKEITETIDDHLHGKYKESFTDQCRRMDGADDWAWRASLLFCLTEVLENDGLWPLPTMYTCAASPRTLADLFRVNPNIPAFVHHHRHRHSHHSRHHSRGRSRSRGQCFCDAEGTLWERIEFLLRTTSFVPSPASADYLAAQAAKSGLKRYFETKEDEIDDLPAPAKGIWNVKDIMIFQRALAQGEVDDDNDDDVGDSDDDE
jgi:hypothetical protein